MDEAVNDTIGERFHELNSRLYTSDPAAYFHRRIAGARSLLTDDSDGRPEDVVISDASTGMDQREVNRFLAIDSQVIVHHAAEAALRIYFAHSPDASTGAGPECPWLEIAADRSPGQFKGKVDEWLARRTGAYDPSVAWVFLGAAEPPGDAPSNWTTAADNASRLLSALARLWLTEAVAYNAVKHGMAIVASDSSLLLVADDDGIGRPMASGMSIEHLDAGAWNDGRRPWQLTTRWLDTTGSLNLAEAAARLIGSAWNVARARYTQTEGARADVWLPDRTPMDLRGPVTGSATRFSINLFFEEKRSTRAPRS